MPLIEPFTETTEQMPGGNQETDDGITVTRVREMPGNTLILSVGLSLVTVRILVFSH